MGGESTRSAGAPVIEVVCECGLRFDAVAYATCPACATPVNAALAVMLANWR